MLWTQFVIIFISNIKSFYLKLYTQFEMKIKIFTRNLSINIFIMG